MSRNSLNRFTPKTISILARRAGYICSNPYCKASTSGPHSEDLKVVNVGEAAHIRGAESGSARHDLQMMPTERSSIINAIWLCSKCSKLIDSDEKKYTVEVLYKWKRDHENEMELRLNETGWQRKIKEFNLRQFENESPAAQQIALDQPERWQYLLTVELLRSKLNVIKKAFDDLKRGLLCKPSAIIDEHQFFVWFRQKLHDLQALGVFLMVASTEELTASMGNSDQLGDALEIKRSVDKIVLGCNKLLDWEIDVYFTFFPEEFEPIKKKMQGWTEHFIIEMDRLPKEISTIFSVPNPADGEYFIKLVFTPPHNLDEVSKEVGNLTSQYT